jgi:hypothetical protein
MARNPQQTFGNISDEFQGYWKNTSRKVHGGVYSEGKRKTARPFDSKKPIHLVLRSSKAKGAYSLRGPKNKFRVDSIVHQYADRFGVRVYDYSNNGNHLHFSVKAPNRQAFQSYLRTITGLISRFILKAVRGKPKGKFWDALAFTRVAEWGQAYGKLKRYIFQNILEGAGIIPHDRDTYKFVSIDSTS